MIITAALLLLVLSGALLWQTRPQAQWSGESAARFASAIILILYAVVLPLTLPALTSVQLLLGQLSAYAAVPLLLSVQVALLLKHALSRMMWGRILLGWCVVFELLRHNTLLESFGWILTGIGAVLTLLSLMYMRNTLSFYSMACWSVMTFIVISRT